MATQEALDALIAHHLQKHGFEKTLEAFRQECKFKDPKKVGEDLQAIFNTYLSSKELRLKQENDSLEANGKSRRKEKKSKQLKSNTESVDGKHAVEEENVVESTKKRKAASEDRSEADAKEAENGTSKKKKGKKEKLPDEKVVKPVPNGALEGNAIKEELSGTPEKRAENVVVEPNDKKSNKKKGKAEDVEPKGREENEERRPDLPSNTEAEKVEMEQGESQSHKKKKGKKNKFADVETKTVEKAKRSEEEMEKNAVTEKAQDERPPSGKKKKEMNGNEEKKQELLDNAGADKAQNGHTASESRTGKKEKKANVEAPPERTEREEGNGSTKKKKDKKLKTEKEQKHESGAENLSVEPKKRKGKKVEAKEKTENVTAEESENVKAEADAEKSENAKEERTPVKEQQLSDRKRKRDDSAGKEKSAGKAFQRVKPEEVEFLDSRLQDNSYWAKDGADNGWGAKAQEVLGQVKGRGFRHEKTKKKRGSYKGGAIDVQSHSIKFSNGSDDEE